MKNNVFSRHTSKQGIYQIDEIVNGKRSWISATNAIWFIPEINDWAIGYLENIGATLCGIHSTGDQEDKSPSDIPNDRWKYLIDSEWKDAPSGDIIINCATI